jgi:hypothetical protein
MLVEHYHQGPRSVLERVLGGGALLPAVLVDRGEGKGKEGDERPGYEQREPAPQTHPWQYNRPPREPGSAKGAVMAKAKKKKAKVRDLGAKKQVKGGAKLQRSGDPCDGGEVTARKLS